MIEDFLLPNEELVIVAEDEKIVLTNMRLLLNSKSYLTTLFLEEICLVEVSYFGDVYYMLLGLVIVFCGEQFLLDIESNVALVFIQLLSCVTVILVWRFFMRARILITSTSGKEMAIMVNKSAFPKIPDFVRKIQYQKNNRLSKLGGTVNIDQAVNQSALK